MKNSLWTALQVIISIGLAVLLGLVLVGAFKH